MGRSSNLRFEAGNLGDTQAVSALGEMLRATDAMNEMAWRGLHTQKRKPQSPAANGESHAVKVTSVASECHADAPVSVLPVTARVCWSTLLSPTLRYPLALLQATLKSNSAPVSRYQTETAIQARPWTTGKTRSTRRRRGRQRRSHSRPVPDARRGAPLSRPASVAWGRALGRLGWRPGPSQRSMTDTQAAAMAALPTHRAVQSTSSSGCAPEDGARDAVVVSGALVTEVEPRCGLKFRAPLPALCCTLPARTQSSLRASDSHPG